MQVFAFSSEIRLRWHSAPYDAKTNVGCLPLRSEMTLGNIRSIHMTLETNVLFACTFVNELR